MRLAIAILEKRKLFFDDALKTKQYQKEKREEIMNSDIDEELKWGRCVRLVGDPVFYDADEHRSVVKALKVLKSALANER